MAREPLTDEERRQVQRLLHQLAEQYTGGWDRLMNDAGVASTTAQAWRYGPAPTTPQTPILVRILRAAGVLTDELLVPGWPRPAQWEAQQAQRAAEEAERAATAIPLDRRPPAQDDQEQTA